MIILSGCRALKWLLLFFNLKIIKNLAVICENILPLHKFQLNNYIMRKDLEKKVNQAIKLIQSASKIAAENGCPEIEVCYSGGKDSYVILELTKIAGIPYRAIYKNTTIDPSGTIKHAKDNGVEIHRPTMSFLDVLKKKGFPSRRARFCCAELKEYKVLDYAILGIRADESVKRARRYKEPEQCRVYDKNNKCRQYFPILNWTKDDVLEFIQERGIKLHPLYYKEDGSIDVCKRLGCVGCPLGYVKHRISEFKQYPNMVKLYVRGGVLFRQTPEQQDCVACQGCLRVLLL